MPSGSGLIPDPVAQQLSVMIKPIECELSIVKRMPTMQCRNQFVMYALKNNLDYVLFIDDDNPPPTYGMYNLLKADKDVVAGIIPARKFPHNPCIYENHEVDGKFQAFRSITDIPLDCETFEVDGVGCGFVLIKTEVLKTIIEKENGISLEGFDYENYKHLKQPFDYITVDNEQVSEDLSFCMKAKKYGFKVWAHNKVRPGHITDPCIIQIDHNNDYQLLNIPSDMLEGMVERRIKQLIKEGKIEQTSTEH